LNTLEEDDSKESSPESPPIPAHDPLLDSQFVSIMRVRDEESIEKENTEPNVDIRVTLAKIQNEKKDLEKKFEC